MQVLAKDNTAAIVDGVIKFLAAGGFITTGLLVPNAIQILDKPLAQLLNKIEARERQREMRRIIYYMKSRGLIRYEPNDYEHGIILTDAGKKRLKRTSFSNLSIERPKKWDGLWRLVFFDIPENKRHKRNSLNLKLKQLGFKQLQISIWVHPFPCRAEIEYVCEVLGIRKYVSYVEIANIDSEKLLRQRFKHLLVL